MKSNEWFSLCSSLTDWNESLYYVFLIKPTAEGTEGVVTISMLIYIRWDDEDGGMERETQEGRDRPVNKQRQTARRQGQ